MTIENDVKKILWVDDEIDNFRHQVELLSTREYDVTTASSGEEATALVRKRHFDLVLLDALMPGKGGPLTLFEIKKTRSDLPVIMLIGSKLNDENEKSIRGCDGFLQKPIETIQLLATCKETLDAKNEKISEDVLNRYYRYYSKSLEEISSAMNANEWIAFFDTVYKKGYEISKRGNEAMRQTHAGLKYEASKKFSEFVAENYSGWIRGTGRKPLLAVDIFERAVLPKLQTGQSVAMIILNGMRLADFVGYEKVLKENFDVKAGRFLSLVPSSPEFTVPALLSGLYPGDCENFGVVFSQDNNIFDAAVMKNLMQDALNRFEVKNAKTNFFDLGENITNDVELVKENLKSARDALASAPSFCAITSENTEDPQIASAIIEFMKSATDAGHTVVLTSGNGHIRCRRTSEIYEVQELDFFPRYVICNKASIDVREAFLLEETSHFKLPSNSGKMCAIAYDKFCFVMPGDPADAKDVLRSGGITPDEMIMPIYVCKKLEEQEEAEEENQEKPKKKTRKKAK